MFLWMSPIKRCLNAVKRIFFDKSVTSFKKLGKTVSKIFLAYFPIFDNIYIGIGVKIKTIRPFRGFKIS